MNADNLVTDPADIAAHYLRGNIINGEQVCKVCYSRFAIGGGIIESKRGICERCCANYPITYTGSQGRHPRFTDDEILMFVRDGADTYDKLLTAMDMTYKTGIIHRIEHLQEQNKVRVTRRKHPTPRLITMVEQRRNNGMES